VSRYLDLAKKVVKQAPLENSREEIDEQSQHRLEEAGGASARVKGGEGVS
jgi:hypothetical protein